jgi:tRNA/rRNA methyltransferase
VPAPAIVLVRPQLADNIGAAARAMKNCGLEELRLVAPRDGWPNPAASPAASGADDILERAVTYSTTAEAVADLHQVYATTARLRDMIKPVLTPRQLAPRLRDEEGRGDRVGLLFGPERTGLENDEVAAAAAVVHVPLDPHFSSLNLAQAVLLLGWEWRMAGDPQVPVLHEARFGERAATAAELDGLFGHLERELETGGFFLVQPKKPTMVRKLRNILVRAGLTEQEVRTLRGVVRALTRVRPVSAAERPEPSGDRRQGSERSTD